MSSEKSRIESFFQLIEHPRFWRGVGLIGVLIVGWYLHVHPELLTLLVSSGAFNAPPSGWIWVTLVCMLLAQWRMHASLAACQIDCKERAARDDTEKSLLRDLIGNLISLAAEARPGVAEKAQLMLRDHQMALIACGLRVARSKPEKPLPGGKRANDPDLQVSGD